MTTWRWCFWRWSGEGPPKWTAATLMFWILRQDLPKTVPTPCTPHFPPPSGVCLSSWRRGKIGLGRRPSYCQRSGVVVQEDWAHSVDQCRMQALQFFSASHWFAEHTSQMPWFCQDAESCSGSDQPQTTEQWPWPFLVQVRFWEVLWSFFSVQPLSWLSLLVV